MDKKNILFFMAVPLLLFSCKEKKKTGPGKDQNFPVLSYIKSQIAAIDTSMYVIYKVTALDTLAGDTVYIPREQFREAAKDFLSIPDISSAAFDGHYTEDKKFDETLNKGMLIYTPVDPMKEEIQRQEVLVSAQGDKVTTIIINWAKSNKDSSVEKNMLWQTDKSFQVTTKKQLPGKPETISTLRVLWNMDGAQ